jgi:hypothetical protein
MSAKSKLSPLSKLPESFRYMDLVRSEFDKFNDLLELLNIAEDYCYWGSEANLIQNLKRVCLLIQLYSSSSREVINQMQGYVMSLETVIHNQTVNDSKTLPRGVKSK